MAGVELNGGKHKVSVPIIGHEMRIMLDPARKKNLNELAKMHPTINSPTELAIAFLTESIDTAVKNVVFTQCVAKMLYLCATAVWS